MSPCLIVVMFDGMGNLGVLDSSEMDQEDEYPVFIYLLRVGRDSLVGVRLKLAQLLLIIHALPGRSVLSSSQRESYPGGADQVLLWRWGVIRGRVSSPVGGRGDAVGFQ